MREESLLLVAEMLVYSILLIVDFANKWLLREEGRS
jgi:hypothetical protein